MNRFPEGTEIYPAVRLDPALVMPGICINSDECFISGQWMFAKGLNVLTQKSIYHELPWSIGLSSPIVINEESGMVTDNCKSPDWYKAIAEKNYHEKIKQDIIIKIHKRHTFDAAWFVNCLLPYYGDCLSLLLRTGPLRETKRGAIALVPSSMVRFVPKWFAEVWEITSIDNRSLQRVCEWNESMNKKINNEFKRFQSVAIPHLFQPAAPRSCDVHEYIGVQPFDSSQWNSKFPVVTLLWREQRLSPPELTINPTFARLLSKGGLLLKANRILKRISLLRYQKFILKVFRCIQAEIPDCTFYVIGLGKFPDLPAWLNDFRVKLHSVRADQRDAQIVSKTNVLISAHGSHLVGLSSLPGCVVQLIPDSKWGNWLDAVSMRDRDESGWINYLSAPTRISPYSLASIVVSRIKNQNMYRAAYSSRYSGLVTTDLIAELRTG
jgi:hypothetical protein